MVLAKAGRHQNLTSKIQRKTKDKRPTTNTNAYSN